MGSVKDRLALAIIEDGGAAAVVEPPPPVMAEAREFVERVVTDPDQRVVRFALEWCEFCWSVRRVFDTYDIAYRSVDLDSAEHQREDWGDDIRAALIF